jgi:hypothetical protein
MHTIKNPITNRNIFVNGPTFNKLLQDPKYAGEVQRRSKNANRRVLSSPKKSQLRKLKGCGSLDKYKPNDGPFCGPEGGACDMTFPVGTKKRAINAVIRSVNAPNPDGIRKCATDHAIKMGWISEKDKIRLLNKYK